MNGGESMRIDENTKVKEMCAELMADDEAKYKNKALACMVMILTDISTNLAIIADSTKRKSRNE